MRLAGLAILILAASACATGKPATPAPGAFERVAERLNESHSLLGVGLTRKEKVEIEAERNPADRRDNILVATRINEIRNQRRLERDAASRAGQDRPVKDQKSPQPAQPGKSPAPPAAPGPLETPPAG